MNRRKFLQKSALATIALSSTSYAASTTSFDAALIDSIDAKLKGIMAIVGYGNFNILSFDEALNVSKSYSKVGIFTKQELEYIEKLFYTDPREFGFYGIRTCNDLTQSIYENDIIKVPHTGHYIYKDHASLYQRLVKDVGDTLILTSGVRSVVKQLTLFISRVKRADYDFYTAAHSLAPPGYSYHSIGDFDVGKVGFGWANFTSRFAKTQEFKRLSRLGYVDIRYTQGNQDGVRYEPWHIQVI